MIELGIGFETFHTYLSFSEHLTGIINPDRRAASELTKPGHTAHEWRSWDRNTNVSQLLIMVIEVQSLSPGLADAQ